MTRGEAKQLIASLVFVLVVTVFLLAFVGIRNVTTQAKPDSGKKGPAVACGRLVESWDIARGMRLDCEFDPSYTPPPLAGPAGLRVPAKESSQMASTLCKRYIVIT
jgi:hypothetical protein